MPTAGMTAARPPPPRPARPRLVAKMGSGLGAAFLRSAGGTNGGRPPTAPDPNVVWNKNRRE